MNISKHFYISFYTLIVIVTSLSSCSLFGSSSIDNEMAKRAVAQVINQNLQFSFLSRMPAVESTIYLSEFLKNQEITYEEFEYRVVRLASKWSINTNPLVLLKVKSIEIEDNDADATLQREGNSFPEIKFQLRWTGSSWVILDDNIYGKNELYEKGL